MIIIGAGLSGLLCGCLFPDSEIYEAGPREQIGHKAVLRFRSSAVGDALGIDFRKVTVHKGIHYRGKFVQPSIALANLYSQKVLSGKLSDRSIWNLDAVDRFIAPEDFAERMADRCERQGRINWNYKVAEQDFANMKELRVPIVSTTPMSVLAKLVAEPQAPDFNYAPITVKRYRLNMTDVFQTIYFPDPATKMYRASITGNLLIVESMREITSEDEDQVFSAFGFWPLVVQRELGESKQSYGKIAPIDDKWRRGFIARATREHGVYSVGRFALWKNVLMDDVLHDIAVVKRLINNDLYEHSRRAI